jgi:AcrR family transcriptional regulator
LLLAATSLFCRDGIHATGVSRLLKDAQVARRTLYERYGSKENLLRAVFANEAAMWYRWFDQDLPLRSDDPCQRLLALFDLLADWFSSGTFYGCIFLNAVAEHNKSGGWLQQLALEHRNNVDRRLVALLQQAGLREAGPMADKLALVIDGAIVTAMVTGNANAAQIARATASDLLRAAGLTVPR